MTKSNIVKSVTWLSVGGILAKLFGGIYKIILTRIIGGENIGAYQQIFPTFTFFVVILTSGLPLAISKLLSGKQNREEKLKSFKNCCRLFFILSLILSVILIFISSKVAYAHGNSKFLVCYYLIIPCLIFSAMAAVLKGYFQSENNFVPTSITQIAEQLIKIVFGLGLSLGLVNFGVLAQVVGAIIGVSAGDLAVLIILFIYYKREKVGKIKASFNNSDLKELLKIIFPIMLSSLVLPFSQLIDSILVVKLLGENFNPDVSNYLYGLQTGVVSALINFPTVITFSIASVLLPNLTEDYKNNNGEAFKNKVSLAIKIIVMFAVPCSLFVLFYPNQIINLLFGGRLAGFNINGEALSAKLLFWSAFNILFLCISQFLSVCLQAREHRYLPAINNFIGMIVKLILELVFIPATAINILAFTLATSIGYFTIFILNLYELIKEELLIINHNYWIKLTLINVGVVAVSLILMSLVDSSFGFVLVSLLSVVMYFFLSFQIKILSKKEIKYIFKRNNK